jgi:hypothetical protein
MQETGGGRRMRLDGMQRECSTHLEPRRCRHDAPDKDGHSPHELCCYKKGKRCGEKAWVRLMMSARGKSVVDCDLEGLGSSANTSIAISNFCSLLLILTAAFEIAISWTLA